MAWQTTLTLYSGVPITDTIYPYGRANTDYFMSAFVHSTYPNQSYTREARYEAQLNINYEDAAGVNFISWKNNNYGNKLFYGRVVEKLYINPNNTKFVWETDALLTFMGDYEYKECYVEREMQAIDFDGNLPSLANTIQEPMELGPMITASEQDLGQRNIAVIVGTATDADGKIVNGGFVSNVYSGVKYTTYTTDVGTADLVNSLLSEYASNGQLDNVVGIWQTYGEAVNLVGSEVTVERPTSIDGYTPENAKLLCWPYVQIEVSNGTDSVKQFAFEDFGDKHSAMFRITSSLAQPITMAAIPLNYLGQASNLDEAVYNSDFPTCCFTGDAFANWYAQNRVSTALNLIGKVALGAGAAVLTGGASAIAGAGVAAASGMVSHASQVAAQYVDRATTKGNAGGNNIRFTGGVIHPPFKVRVLTIKAEYAKRIDNFFLRYGYETGLCKTPNVYTRPNHNYVKTQGCTITGNMGYNHQREIQDKHDAGISFFHTLVGFGDYNYPNRG